MKSHQDAQRALAVAAGLVIVALTVAAFWLSYAHLAGVASAYGMQSSPVRAWAWPACLDLFIVSGELLMLRAALMKTVDPWAIGLTVVGSGGSIALNVAGVGTSAALLDYVVAAVPPTAALLAFGALMRQVHQALSSPARRVPHPVVAEVVAEAVETAEVEPAEVTAAKVPEATTPIPGFVTLAELDFEPLNWPPAITSGDAEATSQVTAYAAAEPARQVVTEEVTITPSELRRKARLLNRRVVRDTNRQVTVERLREEFGLSRRDAVTLRREIVEGAQS